MSLGLCFWHHFSGMKRMCWTTGSWLCCLSLEVVSSIAAGSTIIGRFLCGFTYVSLCQNIKIKSTNMYITSASSKLIHTGVEIDTSAFQMGCQLSSAASGIFLGLCFYTISVAWSKRAFICVFLCQSIKIKPTNMYAYPKYCGHLYCPTSSVVKPFLGYAMRKVLVNFTTLYANANVISQIV